MNRALIRPSSLPKLAECRAYESAPSTSEAAERGSRLDAIIRKGWPQYSRCVPGETCAIKKVDTSGLPEEDVKAVEWAIITMNRLRSGVTTIIETNEELLQAVVPIAGVQAGTMDALCVEDGFLIDFKTGQVRDYEAQMAAYALACMDTYFADTWTAHLLFIDQQLVVTHEFTEAEARELVERIVAAPAEPRSCEYCPWCGVFGSCPVTRTQTKDVMDVAAELPKLTPHAKSAKELPPSLDDIAADDRLAWEFLSKLAVAKDWADILKEKLRKRIEAAASKGEKNAFFTLINRRSKRVFPARGFDHVIGEIGNMSVLSICGPASVDDARALWQQRVQRIPFPEDLIIEQGAGTVLQRKTAKAIPQPSNP